MGTNELISIFIAAFCLPVAIFYFIQVGKLLNKQTKEAAAQREIRGRVW